MNAPTPQRECLFCVGTKEECGKIGGCRLMLEGMERKSGGKDVCSPTLIHPLRTPPLDLRYSDTTFRVEEFLVDIPKYAILSHTWEKDEVTLRDIQDLHEAKGKAELEAEGPKKQAELLKAEKIQRKAGWLKIEKACEYVRQYKFKWIWIDTCCIDKSSSAELSEALNSMFKYYEEAHVCVVYLSDVSIEKNVMGLEELKKSRWFTRGWTLQELIAPRYMVFLDKNWDKIDTRFGIRHIMSEVTSIPVEVFEEGSLDGYSIAQKMSWAASRKTTREEDMAYCLMGLFGVNMPPIYGEGGAKAFIRLQQEIIRYSDDRSIFAWVARDRRDRGMFARSPSEFASSSRVGVSVSDGLGDKSSFSFGNNGLHIHLPLKPLCDAGKDIFYASLHCRDPNGVIGIYLHKQGHRYVRWRPYFSLSHTDEPLGKLQEVVVKEGGAILRQLVNVDIPVQLKLDSDISLLNIEDGNPFLLPCLSAHMFKLRTKKGNAFDIKLTSWTGDVIPVLRMCLLPVDNENALVSFFAHTTGDSSNQRVFEINYIPSSTAKFQLYRQIHKFRCTSHVLTSTTLNFTVDGRSADFFSAPSVFPSEFRWMGDREEVYLSVSYPGEQRNIHCVFQYQDLWFDNVFMALGLRTDSKRRIPWVDVFALTDALSISDVWESYLPLGSRYERRKVGTAATVLNKWRSLAVIVEEKILLGSAWYHVVLTGKSN
ncbi:HET-domain-containing protein [Dendrothele bispora CBS 962.96]|uniref:HET-domain-containing protein n=1 Tax=Dendrothele bispora (strain CBS 962.96) TaxID=1314807 RepID=A0A4S8MH46_DENBC|nr:HET-domain-containing protein [Dendrothele bispora CBS 962.96]